MLAKLQVLAEKADQTAKAVSMDMKNRYHVTQREPLDTDSDSDSDSTSLLSEVAFEDIIDEMSVYMENLLSLATSLEHAAEDNVHVEPSPILVDDLTSVVEPARPFIIIIKDRFPSIDFPLARKLGETNWLRRERLWEKLTAVAEGDAAPTLNDALSRGDTVTDIHPSSHSDQHPTGSIMSGVTLPSVHPSVTTASGFTEPSLLTLVRIYRMVPGQIELPSQLPHLLHLWRMDWGMDNVEYHVHLKITISKVRSDARSVELFRQIFIIWRTGSKPVFAISQSEFKELIPRQKPRLP